MHDISARQLAYFEERFGDGECGIFAQAISRLTGAGIVLFRVAAKRDVPYLPEGFPRHAAVEVGDDLFLDAFGYQTLEEIERRMGVSLRVDRVPDVERYPFGSSSGEEMDEALEMASEMLEIRRVQSSHATTDHSGRYSAGP